LAIIILAMIPKFLDLPYQGMALNMALKFELIYDEECL